METMGSCEVSGWVSSCQMYGLDPLSRLDQEATLGMLTECLSRLARDPLYWIQTNSGLS